MNRLTSLLWLQPVLGLVLVSCASKPPRPIPEAALPPGWHSYNPPKGDPSTLRDWRRFGPGAVIRRPTDAQYLNATVIIGDNEVTNLANKANWTPLSLSNGSEEKKVLQAAALKYTQDALLSANLDAERVKKYQFSYEFGTSFSNEIPQGTFLQTLKQMGAVFDPDLRILLKSGQAHVVQGVLITEGLKVSVYDEKGGKINLDLELTEQQKAALSQESSQVSRHELAFNEARFAAYREMPAAMLKNNGIIR